MSTCIAACTARLRYDNSDQLQPGLGPPSKPAQNLGNGEPPLAPTAGMVMVCSFSAPSDMTMPLGTIKEGWSKGALCERTRSSVSDFRNATTAALSSALKPARCRLGSTSTEGKSPPRL